ncbi:anti-sigma factor antagonist [Streptomyces avidinii]
MTGPAFRTSAALDVDVARLRLVGELDLDGAAQLRAAVADCLARLPGRTVPGPLVPGPLVPGRAVPGPAVSARAVLVRVVLDLSDLRFCDCAGLNVLMEAKATADRIGTELSLEGAHPQVARLFALTGVDALFGGVPCLPPRTP